jgi:hypothetical protein
MREGCIGKQNSRIGKWQLESGKREEAISEQITASRKQEARIDGKNKDDERALNEEVEGEKEETQDEEEGTEGEAALGEAADGVEKARGDYAEA